MNAASDVSESLRWCQASVRIALLSIDSPVRNRKRNSSSLITTTSTSTMSVNGAGA